jgi:hypothetical protein
MKSKRVECEIKRIEDELRETAENMGVKKFSKETGLNSKDVSAWIHGHRKFSYEKILRIAHQIEKQGLSYREPG